MAEEPQDPTPPAAAPAPADPDPASAAPGLGPAPAAPGLGPAPAAPEVGPPDSAGPVEGPRPDQAAHSPTPALAPAAPTAPAPDPAATPAPPSTPGPTPTQPASPVKAPRRPSRSTRDRARRRAVRAHAAETGVAYSVAARQIAAAALSPGETLASAGRTVYPIALTHGRWTILARELRTAEEKLATTRQAARLPTGRAHHLADRFPPGETQGMAFYAGEARADLLALVYLTAAHEAPGLIPPPLDLAWTAELGEETAVDTACTDLDRAARAFFDDRPASRWHRIDAALAAAQHHPDPSTRYAADLLTLAHRRLTTPREDPAGEPQVPAAPWPGARQTLDALLVISEDGHAPGTRVRLPGRLPRPEGTVTGAHWLQSGAPTAYDILLDNDPIPRTLPPSELVVLPAQESDAPALTH